MSKSTKGYDRTDKFRYYRSITELQEYVLIDQYGIAIEQYTKTDKNAWLFRAYESDAEKINFTPVNVEMALAEPLRMSIADIYEGVDFSLKDLEE